MIFDKDQLAARRQALMDAMGPDSVAIIVSAPMRQRSNDSYYPYRPSSDLLYLTGFEEPETVVALAPGHPDGEFVMFVPPRDPERETWDGRRFGPAGAVDVFGADQAFDNTQMSVELPRWLQGRDTLYYTLGHESFDSHVTGWMRSLRMQRGKPSKAPRQIVDLRDLLHEMRLFKSEYELGLMRTAADITSQAHIEAMRACAPGMYEFQVQSVLESYFLTKGAQSAAYGSIVASGDNATILHYTVNRAEMGKDDILLIDAGAEYKYYAADITRSFPVDGVFSGPQRDLYQAVLEVQKAAIADATVGTVYSELQDNAVRRLTEAAVGLGLLKGSMDALLEEKAIRRYYPHNIGHWLGMDVHDVGSYFQGDTHRKLEPSMVITIEPGLYVPAHDEEAPAAFRGIGIRIEDDVLITDQGPEVLTAACPKSVDEIESLMKG